MHPKRKKRLLKILFIFISLSLASIFILFGLKKNINLFYSPTEIVNNKAPLHRLIRVGGLVKPGSVHYAPHPALQVNFILTDEVSDIPISYSGLLPDLFREGQGIVAEGLLDTKQVFIASEVLAKHDATYMPKEVADALKTAHLAAIRRHEALPNDPLHAQQAKYLKNNSPISKESAS